MGEIKLGTLKGQDEHGNMYYENLKYQFGKDSARKMSTMQAPLGRIRRLELEI